MKMYAGAGKCDLKAGVYVGDVKVTYSGTVTVEWLSQGIPSGVDYSGAHWYAGNTRTAMTRSGKTSVPTVTPGQFPVVQSSVDILPAKVTTNTTFSGNVYVTIHGSLCFAPIII